jgi:hypothetical protein
MDLLGQQQEIWLDPKAWNPYCRDFVTDTGHIWTPSSQQGSLMSDQAAGD